MNIDLSGFDPQKREAAQKILDQLNEINAAQAAEVREKITKEIEALTETDPEKQINISKLSDSVWLSTCYKILAEAAEPFGPENHYDEEFFSLIKITRETDCDFLFKIIWDSVSKLKAQSEETYKTFVKYFAKFPLWGTLDPAHNNFDTLRRRATVLKQHSYDFVWLYRRFPDYLSKYTLTAILANWLIMDLATLNKVKSIFPDYYEPDIFQNNKDDIFVDIGAFTGDSILQYVASYGKDYKKIYAYEITERSCNDMRRNLKELHDVEIRRKGAGAKPGEMFLNASSSDPSANQLSDALSGNAGDRVEIVKLDDDIPDGFTFLKMDIEGAEYDALLGAEQTIRRCRPKLAICVYHGYDDIWRIPLLIDSFDPNYTFYLRHNGGNLIPTEFVLLCKPNDK